MKYVNKVLFPVISVIFVVTLNDFDDDESTVNCIITKDNKKIWCASYDVCLDLPKVSYDLVRLDKSSHSRTNWNENLKKLLNRSSFDSMIKMLELNTSDRINFIIERMDVELLKHYFRKHEIVFSAGLNELDLVKI